MTLIPARLMRAQVNACPSRPRPTERDRQRRAYIIEAATRIFATHGRTRVTMRAFATATGLGQTTIRRHIYDLDHLFALVLARHLDAILAAIGAVPNGPSLHARRRAEYRRATRGHLNTPAPLHALWLRDRFTLPEDELAPLEQTISLIGHLLAGEAWQTALLLLDSPHLDQTQIETMLAAHATAAEPEHAAPQAPQAAAHPHHLSQVAVLAGAASLQPIPPRLARPPPRAAA